MSLSLYHGRVRPMGVRRLSAAVVAGVMALAAVLLPPRSALADTPWLSVSEDGYASFTVPAAYVQTNVGQVSQVVVEGNFGPSSAWAEFGLTRRGDAWSGILGPLKPGLYYYQVTGDETNATTVASKPLWSTFLVAGDSARLLADAPEGQGGKVGTLTYRVGKQERSALVWTPPGYPAKGGKPLPVLYLLSGPDRSATDWLDLGRARQILDNLSAGGSIEPMVVVITDGRGPDDDKDLKDLRKAVGDAYRVHHDREHQAIAGVSEGGSQALRPVSDTSSTGSTPTPGRTGPPGRRT
ncbi:alpha/beta hydrolase-fold protein [Microbispora triticiradicis]|uniref:alpha/beta hydrolase n=1 Tax=Microbispora triticiradicis TaxID=2200763 RepID=UPI001AD7F137|nr:alpha/beta hydrolase-fold protein [Microbispora triticiradicis]